MSTETKPMIRYREVIVPPTVGGRALIALSEEHHTLRDDPYRNPGRVVTTSVVQEIEEGTGRFWTQNTFYVPDERPS